MEKLTYEQRIAAMRILLDIIWADRRLDSREKALFDEIAAQLDLDMSARKAVEEQNSLLALLAVRDMEQEQKEKFAQMMGQMIVVDRDINYDEVRIYNVVCEFCEIKEDFRIDDYPGLSRSWTDLNI